MLYPRHNSVGASAAIFPEASSMLLEIWTFIRRHWPHLLLQTVDVMSNNPAKDDAQALVDEFITFAEKLLREHGEFYPFGGHMKVDGRIVWEGASDKTEHPRSQPLIEILREAHRNRALNGEIRASCIVYDILAIPPGKEEKQDAIAIEIDHRDSYSVFVVFPYTLTSNGVLDVELPYAVSRHNTTFEPVAADREPSGWKITTESLTSAQVSDEA